MTEPHKPVPTSPTGKLDSPVSCAECGAYLYLGEELDENGYVKWRHVEPTPPPVSEDAIRSATAAAMTELERQYHASVLVDLWVEDRGSTVRIDGEIDLHAVVRAAITAYEEGDTAP